MAGRSSDDDAKSAAGITRDRFLDDESTRWQTPRTVRAKFGTKIPLGIAKTYALNFALAGDGKAAPTTFDHVFEFHCTRWAWDPRAYTHLNRAGRAMRKLAEYIGRGAR